MDRKDEWIKYFDDTQSDAVYSRREKIETAVIIVAAASLFLGAWYWSISSSSPLPIISLFALCMIMALAEGTETSLDGRG